MATVNERVPGVEAERPEPEKQRPSQPARKPLNPQPWHPKLASFFQPGVFDPVAPAVVPWR